MLAAPPRQVEAAHHRFHHGSDSHRRQSRQRDRPGSRMVRQAPDPASGIDRRPCPLGECAAGMDQPATASCIFGARYRRNDRNRQATANADRGTAAHGCDAVPRLERPARRAFVAPPATCTIPASPPYGGKVPPLTVPPKRGGFVRQTSLSPRNLKRPPVTHGKDGTIPGAGREWKNCGVVGWGTWIRTRTNGVRVRGSTVNLFPNALPCSAAVDGSGSPSSR